MILVKEANGACFHLLHVQDVYLCILLVIVMCRSFLLVFRCTVLLCVCSVQLRTILGLKIFYFLIFSTLSRFIKLNTPLFFRLFRFWCLLLEFGF